MSEKEKAYKKSLGSKKYRDHYDNTFKKKERKKKT